jgi:argininosuccinate lyase
MQKFSAFVEKDVFDALSLERTLSSKSQIGGTAPERVFEALEKARREIEMEEE